MGFDCFFSVKCRWIFDQFDFYTYHLNQHGEIATSQCIELDKNMQNILDLHQNNKKSHTFNPLVRLNFQLIFDYRDFLFDNSNLHYLPPFQSKFNSRSKSWICFFKNTAKNFFFSKCYELNTISEKLFKSSKYLKIRLNNWEKKSRSIWLFYG